MSSRSRVEAAWSDQSLEPLGRPGYNLPNIDGFNWHPIGDPQLDNWAVVSNKVDWPDAKIKIELADSASGNVIIYGQGSRAEGHHVVWGRNNLVIFAEDNPQHVVMNLYVNGDNTKTFVGNRTTCNGAAAFIQGDGTQLIIGEDCMLSHGIVIRTSDDHAIFDLDTGVHLNKIESVIIEPYVWLCPEVHVLKGVRVGFGSIVAERSLVTTDVSRCTLVGGVPARLLRERVSWDRSSVPDPGRQLLLRILVDKYDW